MNDSKIGLILQLRSFVELPIDFVWTPAGFTWLGKESKYLPDKVISISISCVMKLDDVCWLALQLGLAALWNWLGFTKDVCLHWLAERKALCDNPSYYLYFRWSLCNQSHMWTNLPNITQIYLSVNHVLPSYNRFKKSSIVFHGSAGVWLGGSVIRIFVETNSQIYVCCEFSFSHIHTLYSVSWSCGHV